MNNLKKTIKKYNYIVKSYRKIGNVYILDTNQGTFCLKKKNRSDICEIIKYLKTKKFYNVLDLKSDEEDEYEITDYVKEVIHSKEDKAMEIIYLMSMLHNKTTFYKSIPLDETKSTYENHIKLLASTRSYFDNLCYAFDENIFPSPSEYLLIRNVSKIFNALDYSKYYIDKWYNISKDKTSKRLAMTHNNLSLSHIVVGDNPYLINWNKASINSPIADLHSFFKINFLDIDIPSLFQVYYSKYQLLEEEIYLLFAKMLLPDKLEFKGTEINKVKIVFDCYKYLLSVLNFASKYDLAYNKQESN